MTNNLAKSVLIFSLILALLGTNAFAQDISKASISRPISFEAAASMVRSPKDLARFFSQGFEYQWAVFGEQQDPEETLEKGTGDCDDCAALASALLTRIRVPNDIVYIRFKGLNVGHAICAWKRPNGRYSFVSNFKVLHTQESTLKGAVTKYYPDLKKFSKNNPRI